MNGVTCDAVGGGAGVAVHDGGVLGPTSRRRKPQLLRSPERSAQDIRSDEWCQQAPVGDDQRRRNCCGEGGFVRAGRRCGLVAVCCACSPVAPSLGHIRCGGGDRPRTGTCPRSAGQGPDDRAVVCRRGTQLLGQRLRRKAETGARGIPQTRGSPALAGGGPSPRAVIDASPWPRPGRTPRCPRPSAGHDRGAAVHPSSCRG